MSDMAARVPRVLAPAVRARDIAARLVHSDRAMIGALSAWVFLLIVLTWARWGDITMDLGYDLTAAAKTAGGELPYIDYGYFYGPLAPLLLGGVYALAGPSVGAAAVVGLVLAIVAVALAYRLGRLLVGPLPAALAGAFTAAMTISSENTSWVLPHSTSAPLAVVLMLTVVLLLAGREQPSRGRLLLAGLAAGAVVTARWDMGLFILGTAGAWALVRIWRADGGRAGAVRDAATVFVPALAVPALVYGAFLTQISLNELVFENLYSRDFFAAAGKVVLEGHAPLTAGSFAWLGGQLVVYAAGTAGLLALASAIAAGGRLRTLALAAAAVAALGLLAVLVVRPETLRFYLAYAYAWIPAGAWIGAAVLLWRSRRGPWTVERAAALLALVLLAVWAANTYRSFRPFPNPLHPDGTPYMAAVVGVLLVWLHVRVLPAALPSRRARAAAAVGTAWVAALLIANTGLALHDARQETSTFSGPGGTLHARAAEGPVLSQAMAAIEAETRPGDPILVAPRLTALYVMSDRENPLPQLSLLPGMLPTPADERRAIEQMRDVRLVLLDRTPLETYARGTFGEGYNNVVGAWVRREFSHVRTIPGSGEQLTGIEIWKREGTR